MYQGTNASSGIGIGTAVIVEEAELVIKREAVVDAEAEVKRFHNQTSGALMAGNIGGISGHNVSNNLVHRIVPFLSKRCINQL